jgi:glycosyltransferase involved in cell wall biosynthesis
MKISIITVAYNSAATILDTLRSVASQTYADIEYIVIDGGSRDDTVALVQRYAASKTILVSEPDKGIYDAMNKGLALATGDVVGFLNSDDILANKEVISKIANEFSDSKIDACYGDLVYVAQDDLSKVVRYWKSRSYEPGLCAKGWMPAHPTFYVRRSVYQRHGGFDLSMKLQADFEMALKLLHTHQIRTKYLPEVLVRMRMGGASNASIKNVILGNMEASRACIKHGVPGGFLFIVRKVLSRIPQFFQRPPHA